MGFTARQQGKAFKPIPAGLHRGVCSVLVDVGLQEGGQYNDTYKIVLGFTLPGIERDDGAPTVISGTFTNSMNKKANLRKLIQSWFGKDFASEELAKKFDLSKLLKLPAYVNVTNSEKGDRIYANIGGLVPLPPEVPKPTVEDADVIFYTEAMEGETKARAYAALPEWIRNKVDAQIRPETPVVAGSSSVAAEIAVGDDDIPF